MLQQARVEREGQEILQLMLPFFFLEVGEQDLEIAAEFPENLAARAARRGRRGRVGDDGDAGEGAMALRQRLEHGHPFRANREAVGGVLDVAARHDRPVGRFERGADFEVRKGRVGELTRPARGADEIDFARMIAQPPRAKAAAIARCPGAAA